MKVLATSDLHGNLPEISTPADLLLICGDIVPLNIQAADRKSRRWLETDFSDWANELPVDKVIFIGGNHDWYIYRNQQRVKDYFPKDGKVVYIQDEVYEYKGLKIYGTPWCKIFYNWAFMISDEELAEKYSLIPEGLDVLISHDAPAQNELGIIHQGWSVGTNASNSQLSVAVGEKKPRFHFCGHIHSGEHIAKKVGETTFANCSLVDESYEAVNDVQYYEI